MKAWTHIHPGHPSAVLSLSLDLPQPAIFAPKDVLIKITHASLNPGASIMMQLCPSFLRKWPAIPEMDFSGVIVELGPGVSPERKLNPGDHVFGSITVRPHLSKGIGALAEYVVVDEDFVIHKPQNVDLADVSGLGVAGCTALELVHAAKQRGSLKPGDTVLVNGASGGIGCLVVQMAKNMVGQNGRVIGMCSGPNMPWVRGLGADQVIDCNFLPRSKPQVECILDCFGSQALFSQAAEYLPPWKSLHFSVAQMAKNAFFPWWLDGVARPYVQVTGLANNEGLNQLATLIAEGKLRVPRDKIWDFDDALQAYDILLRKKARGKLIVRVQDP